VESAVASLILLWQLANEVNAVEVSAADLWHKAE
jgi:hypothetical protein